MFGGKNARRVEARRIPSSKKRKRNENPCCGGCCQSLTNCCISCGAHGWFLTLFCGYVLVSSLPRILIILDFIITLSLYFDYNGIRGLKDQNWISNTYTFKHSTFDIVVVSFIRCIILFICFAYRYQREGFRKNLYISFTTVLLTSCYLIIKLYFSPNKVVIFSLSFVWIECIFFFMVRRRRIRYAPTISNVGSYYSLSQRDRKIMKPKQSEYYRIDDEDLSQNKLNYGINKEYTPELVNNNNGSQSPNAPLNQPPIGSMKLYSAHLSSSDDILMASSHPKTVNATPPPFINDTYLDDIIGEYQKNESEGDKKTQKKHYKNKKNKKKIKKEDEVNENELELKTEDEMEEKEEKKIERRGYKKRKSKKTIIIQQQQQQQQQQQHSINNNNNFSMEHSISATVPDSEFSAHELPLRTENSEFFIIDGVAIHYCFERNYNEKVINNEEKDDIPWIILLHGFGGGVFSWKRTIPMILNDLNDGIRGILSFDRVGFGLTERPLTDSQETSDYNTYYDNDSNLGQAITPSNKPISEKYKNKEDENNPYSIHFSLKIIKTFLDKFEMKKCILIGHSTGGLIANWFTYHYPKYVKAVILISPTTGMPAFVRSILKTKLGKPIILSLVRSEIGQVTLHQAWHNPSVIPSSVINCYKQVLKLKNWNESLLEMARVKPYSNSSKYHKSLSMIQCPVWILHGDDDKLVTFRESLALSQYFKYSFGPIKLKNCGHIPHEEIPKEFVNIIKNIIINELKQFNDKKNDEIDSNDNKDDDDDDDDDDNIISKGAQKFKQIITNINIMHRKGSDKISLKNNESNQPLTNNNNNDDDINNNDAHNINIKVNEDPNKDEHIIHVNENSALLSD